MSSCLVEILVFNDFQLLDVTGPLQVLASANAQVTSLGFPPYEVRVVSTAASGRMVASSAGIELAAAPLPDPGSPLHTLLIPGGPGIRREDVRRELAAWVRQRAAHATRVVSVCTGAFLLADLGLLDGKRAVTHWAHCATLADQFPAIDVQADALFVRDGAIWTSAGVTAGIDLALALVEEDIGRATALAVARELVVFLKRPGGQAQFSASLALQETDARFATLHTWISEHLAEELSMPRLADKAGMSVRTFSRRYRQIVGATPLKAVARLRVELARHLLCDTHLPVKRIAARCGFGSEETMRRKFHMYLSISPVDYRNRFSSGDAGRVHR